MTHKPLSLRFIVTATLLGNTLEWYDYVTFGFLAHFFSQVFFQHGNAWATLRFTLIGVAFGAFLRPIGGLVFGFIGDRFGRRIALLSSILFITIPTFLIGLLPILLAYSLHISKLACWRRFF
jgi:MHS family proline/betaine transporter-like MFS transporter